MASIDTPAPPAHSDSGKRNFLARLWYDKETRGVILQILTVAILFAFIAYITSNAIANLALLGKTFSFDFLNMPVLRNRTSETPAQINFRNRLISIKDILQNYSNVQKSWQFFSIQ